MHVRFVRVHVEILPLSNICLQPNNPQQFAGEVSVRRCVMVNLMRPSGRIGLDEPIPERMLSEGQKMRLTYFAELYQQLIGFPRSVKLFYLSDIFFGFGLAIFTTLFNLHLLASGYTADHVGRLTAIASITMALFSIPIGILADRYGRRLMYVTGSLLFGIPYMLLPFVHGFPLIAAVTVVSILGQSLMFVNETPLLAGEVEPDRRAGVFSLMFINFFIWHTLGTQMAGMLPGWLPSGGNSIYQWPLVVAGTACLGAGALRIFMPFRPQPPARAGLRLTPSRAVMAIGIYSFLGGSYSALLLSFNNVILSQRFSMSDQTIGTVLAIGGVAGWFGTLFVPWLTGRFGTHRAAVALTTLQGAVLFGLGLAAAPALYVPVLWIRSVTSTLNMSVWPTFQMEVTAAEERATATSYSIVGRNIGIAVAAPLLGGALTAGRFGLSFALAGTVGLLAALFLWVAFRETKFD